MKAGAEAGDGLQSGGDEFLAVLHTRGLALAHHHVRRLEALDGHADNALC